MNNLSVDTFGCVVPKNHFKYETLEVLSAFLENGVSGMRAHILVN